jgi:hypothetical protein
MVCETPVVIVAFNRPDTVLRLINCLRPIKPKNIYLIVDGPRKERVDDYENCKKVISLLESIEWPCNINRNYSPVNLGCRNRFNSGLDWVFSNVESAIILEDDCLPHPDFFPYCEELLDLYKNDGRLWMISGNNFQSENWRGDSSYYFSRYTHIWGWATWRRAWIKNDQELTFWPSWQGTNDWKSFWPSKNEASYWEEIMNATHAKRIDTWDYAWMASMWKNFALAIVPNVNMISNIGFDDRATHTKDKNCNLSNLKTKPIGTLVHPRNIYWDSYNDEYIFKNIIQNSRYSYTHLIGNLVNKIVIKLEDLFRGSIFRQKKSKLSLLDGIEDGELIGELNVAVTYFIYNRPEITKNSFERIRSARPKKLFIFADGPKNSEGDLYACKAARDVVSIIDWPCDVERVYEDSNVGLQQQIIKGLDYVFSKTDRAIILEDDCIPGVDFFNFCTSLLEKYEQDDYVSVITGNNFQDGQWRGTGSYYFSHIPHCWGWATWSKAWKHFDKNLTFWPHFKDSDEFKKRFPKKRERNYWSSLIDLTHQGKINSWAYIWMASLWYSDQLTAVPNVNLVVNIGFGDSATNTSFSESSFANIPAGRMPMIQYLPDSDRNNAADEYVYRRIIEDNRFRPAIIIW